MLPGDQDMKFIESPISGNHQDILDLFGGESHTERRGLAHFQKQFLGFPEDQLNFDAPDQEDLFFSEGPSINQSGLSKPVLYQLDDFYQNDPIYAPHPDARKPFAPDQVCAAKNQIYKKVEDRRTNYCEEDLSEADRIDHMNIELSNRDAEAVSELSKKQARVKKKCKKISKFLLKEKSFKGSDKISLPKKIGKLFANYLDDYPSGDPEVDLYNSNLKQNLKKTVKNDYTFEKTISHFLGEVEMEDGQMLKVPNADNISKFYRTFMPKIITQTMKQEVIMRQKIQRNKQVYMLQLKVYCLRCRSHKLAQKGCFK